jgi:PPOX class probable F420-dependent enzyme
VKQRDRVAMTPDEVAAMLAGCRKVQLATINPDGMPHLVTMYYTLIDGKIAFWTYRSSQKALNLARDPRISCLVETGDQYFDLKGVQIQGDVVAIEDPAEVQDIGRRITEVMGPADTGTDTVGEAAEALRDYVLRAARKRFGYLVEPRRVISWDHSKLLPG